MAEEKTPLKWKFETGDDVFSSPAVSDGSNHEWTDKEKNKVYLMLPKTEIIF